MTTLRVPRRLAPRRRTVPIIGLSIILIAGGLVTAAMIVANQDDVEIGYAAERLLGRRDGRLGLGGGDRDLDGVGGEMEVRGRWNGVEVAPTNGLAGRQIGLAPTQDGVIVVDIDRRQGERIRRAGMQVGDVIVAINQRPVRNLADLHARSVELPPGSLVMFDVQRGGQLMSLVAPPEPTQQVAAPNLMGPQLYCPRDGVLVPREVAGAQQVCPICNGPLHLFDPNAGM